MMALRGGDQKEERMKALHLGVHIIRDAPTRQICKECFAVFLQLSVLRKAISHLRAARAGVCDTSRCSACAAEDKKGVGPADRTTQLSFQLETKFQAGNRAPWRACLTLDSAT